MITVPMGTIEIPTTVVVCPICGDQVVVEVTEITQDYDKSWRASEYGFNSSCVTEPDITDPGYEAWLDNHFRMPYIDWLPVDCEIAAWLDLNYRFTTDEERRNSDVQNV